MDLVNKFHRVISRRTKETRTEQTTSHTADAKSAPSPKGRTDKKFSAFQWTYKRSEESHCLQSRGRFLRNSVEPPPVFPNQVYQPIDSFCFRNIEFDGLLPDIKVYLTRRAPYISEICIRHFAGPVYDATHDRDLYAFQVVCGGLDTRGGLLQVKQRPAAGWTRNVICFENSGSSGLQNIVGEAKRLPRRGFSLDQDCVSNTVTKQRSKIGRRLEKRLQKVAVRIVGWKKCILQQNRMTRVQGCRKPTESRDNRQIEVVLDSDKSSFSRGIKLGNRSGIGRIDWRQMRGFQDAFRLEITHFAELMHNAVERLLSDHHPDGFLTADADSVALDSRGGPLFVGKWVKRKRVPRPVCAEMVRRPAVVFRDQ